MSTQESEEVFPGPRLTGAAILIVQFDVADEIRLEALAKKLGLRCSVEGHYQGVPEREELQAGWGGLPLAALAPEMARANPRTLNNVLAGETSNVRAWAAYVLSLNYRNALSLTSECPCGERRSGPVAQDDKVYVRKLCNRCATEAGVGLIEHFTA